MEKKVVGVTGVKLYRNVDHRLSWLLSLGLEAIREQQIYEFNRDQKIDKEISSLRQKWLSSNNEKDRHSIQESIKKLEQEWPKSMVYGVFFPDDSELKQNCLFDFNEPYIHALIKTNFSDTLLKKHGVHIRSRAGSIVSVALPWAQIIPLTKCPQIHYIEVAHLMAPDVDTGIPYHEIDQIQAAPHDLDGEGVVVGVIDSSLSVYHPDLRKNDGFGGDGLGRTVIKHFWQVYRQNSRIPAPEVDPPEVEGYGYEFTEALINQELENFDPDDVANSSYQVLDTPRASGTWHGTAVLGIIAGQGHTDPRFRGVAPAADFIFVQNNSQSRLSNYIFMDNTEAMDGFSYIFRKAGSKPCVVNMSRTDNMGPHDGTTLGEQFLDELLNEQKGRAITISAGNMNRYGLHGKAQVEGQTASIVLKAIDFISVPEQVEFWFNSNDELPVTFSYTLPIAGEDQRFVLDPILPDGPEVIVDMGNEIQCRLLYQTNDPRNGDTKLTAFFTGAPNQDSLSFTEIRWEFDRAEMLNGHIDGYLERNNFAYAFFDPYLIGRETIMVPATAKNLIAVGNHNAERPPLINSRSGCGPTRDGRIKPDICAFGTGINLLWGWNVSNGEPDSWTYPASGTSYSAPMVAGAIALLFQSYLNNNKLLPTAYGVKRLLQKYAEFPQGGSQNAFGFGYLQMAQVIEQTPPEVDVWIADSYHDLGRELETYQLTYGITNDVVIRDVLGEFVHNATHNSQNDVNNFVDVTVRNRGTEIANRVNVRLEWATPGMGAALSSQRNSEKIFVESRFEASYPGAEEYHPARESNFTTIPEIAPGESVTIRFAWAPPDHENTIRGNDNYALIVYVRSGNDRALGVTDPLKIWESNNYTILQRRVLHFDPQANGGNPAPLIHRLLLASTDGKDGLEIGAGLFQGTLEIVMPAEILPWRDLEIVEGQPFPIEEINPMDNEADIREATGIQFAERLHVEGSHVVLTLSVGNDERQSRIVIPEINVPVNQLPVMVWRVHVTSIQGREQLPYGIILANFLYNGTNVNGASLFVTEEEVLTNQASARFENDRLIVEP